MQQFEHAAMNTTFALFIPDGQEGASGAAHAAWRLVDKLEQTFNRFIDVSETATIAALKPGNVVPVTPEMMDCLMVAVNVYAATNGAFDITVGSLMNAFRKAGCRWAGVTEIERKTALAATGMNRLVLDPEHERISVTPDRNGGDSPLELDFGGIAKGYALDAVKVLLTEEWELKNFLIHGGTSTVLAVGREAPDKAGWPVGVAGDWAGRLKLGAVEMTEMAVSGSGFDLKGEHIANTQTGQVARVNPAAWSCATSAAVSDALSTAFMGMTWAEIQKACEALADFKAGALVPRGQQEWLDAVRKPARMTPCFQTLVHATV